ncbi:hypothetical protein M0811_03916 [Anaeramoeba ignava]|uniref:BTB domain-containing protein n=1 Tax=Anaeramoeba ignava TaxID=1746090 RepID=A0A9Q0LXI0_ANAIG|nr:hypothetical protein M0811_03916 [Anaeramoeba ignava]
MKKLNDIIFAGDNQTISILPNNKRKIKRFTKIKISDTKQIKQISSSQFSTIFLFENGEAIEYLNKKFSLTNPQRIPIKNIIKVSAGCDNEVVLSSEGNAFAKGKDINKKKRNTFYKISEMIPDQNDRIIKDAVCGGYSVYLLTEKGNVYGIGGNYHGQLAQDSPIDIKKLILVNKNVSKIFTGSNSKSVFFLNENQELFCCGDNSFNKLGIGNKKDKQAKIRKVENVPKGKIIDIQCGDFHSLLLMEVKEKEFISESENENENEKENQKEYEYTTRKIYSCGYYKYNGHDSSDDKLYKGENTVNKFAELKLFLEDDTYPSKITIGERHSLILTSNGKLYTFGENLFGQLGTGTSSSEPCPRKIKIPELAFNEDISNYHVVCGTYTSFIYYSPSLSSSNLEEDLIKLFRRKEFCDISFKTKNEEIIEAHKLILKYRLNQNQNQNEIEKLKEIISNKSIKESNQIFEMIYSNKIINPKLYSEIKEIINSNEKIEETMKRIYLNENEKDFIIERNEKQYKFPKLILIMRSELYRGMFLSVTEDKSNKVTDYGELSDKSFQILEYWIYSNQIKEEIEITEEMIDEIKIGIDYFQLNQINPNLLDLLINQFKKQNPDLQEISDESEDSFQNDNESDSDDDQPSPYSGIYNALHKHNDSDSNSDPEYQSMVFDLYLKELQNKCRNLKLTSFQNSNPTPIPQSNQKPKPKPKSKPKPKPKKKPKPKSKKKSKSKKRPKKK